MADIFTKDKRSEIMSKIRGTNTKPEMLIRKFLFSQGFRFRLHQKSLPGRPDIVLKQYNTVVIVNGCFWHGHEKCNIFKMPKSRVDFWHGKISRNKARDSDNLRALKRLKWNIVTVWECQLKKTKVERTLADLIRKIQGNNVHKLLIKSDGQNLSVVGGTLIFGQNLSHMNIEGEKIHTLGEHLRNLRRKSNLPLREVANSTGIDISLLGKIERNKRQATKEQVRLISVFYGIDEKQLLKELLSDQFAFRMIEEEADLDILKVAEEKVEYLKANNHGK